MRRVAVTLACTAITMSAMAAPTVARADGWESADVASSDELLEPRAALTLQPSAGSITATAGDGALMAYPDRGALKVVTRVDGGWGAPATAVGPDVVGDVDDLQATRVGGEAALVWLDETPRGVRRILVTRSSAGTWNGSTAQVYAKAATPKFISLAHGGGSAYLAFHNPVGVISSNYRPEFWRVPESGEPVKLPGIPDVERVGKGYVVASGPDHLAYAWLQQSGSVDTGPYALRVAFLDLRSLTWSAPQQVDDRAYDLDLAGSAEVAASGATGVLVWEEALENRDRRIGAARLSGGNVGEALAATPANVGDARELRAVWNAGADSAVVACLCTFTEAAVPLRDADRLSIRSIIVPGSGEIPMFTVVAGRDVDSNGRPVAQTGPPLSAHRLNLAGPDTGALRANLTWQTSGRAAPVVSAAAYAPDAWSAVGDLGPGQWPLAVPAAGPAVLTWSDESPYRLVERSTTYSPRPSPEPEDISVVITGTRTSGKGIRISGTVTGATGVVIAQPYLRMVKAGQRWKALSETSVTPNASGTGSFAVLVRRTNVRYAYKAYVIVDDVRSNTVTIPAARG